MYNRTPSFLFSIHKFHRCIVECVCVCVRLVYNVNFTIIYHNSLSTTMIIIPHLFERCSSFGFLENIFIHDEKKKKFFFAFFFNIEMYTHFASSFLYFFDLISLKYARKNLFHVKKFYGFYFFPISSHFSSIINVIFS